MRSSRLYLSSRRLTPWGIAGNAHVGPTPDAGGAALTRQARAASPATTEGKRVDTGAFTGRLEFDLGDPGQALATVDVAVRSDVVVFTIGGRNLAVADRDRLRDWLVHPWSPITVDQLTFLMMDGDFCISIDGSTPYVVPVDVARGLAANV